MRGILIVLAALTLAVSGASAADLKAGKKVFNKCKSCHSIGAKVRRMTGPPLNGIMGRAWGTAEKYKYSAGREGTLMAIHEATPMTWDVETLSAYLRKPKDVIPKGKMAFAGLKKDEDIEAVIRYLASFDEEGGEVDPEAVLAALAEAGEGEEPTAE